MKIIDRYVAREFVLPFIACLTIFISLFIIIDLCSRMEDILKQHVDWRIMLKYYLTFLPIIFVHTAPVAALLSTLYVLGDLSKYNEVLALKASGMNIWRLALPFFFLGLIISIATLLINVELVPRANLISTTIKEEYLSTDKKVSEKRIITNVALYAAHNRLIHVYQFYPQDNRLKEITILEQDEDERVTAKIQAKEAVWKNNRWEFYDCVVYNFNNLGQVIDEPYFAKKMLLDIEETPKDFLRRESSAEFMDLKQLKDYIKRLSGSTAKIVQKLLVELHYKISFPFISLVIIFLGIPFALSTQGTGKIASLGLCILIVFFYFSITNLSRTLGEYGTLPPLLSAWFANILFTSVAIMLMRRTSK
ncbi:MAG: LptF/LptG family permease [Omnitrophica bacterium]|nr:LptF/LptG family permease [Candidatus Omnitrophota bacterium]